MSATYTAMSKYLKTNYVANGKLYDQFQGVDPFFNMVLKNPGSGNKTGKSITYPIAVGRSTSVSSNFKSAQDQAKAGNIANKRQSVVVPFDDDVYAVGRVQNKAIYATKDGAGAFVKAVEDETKMVSDALKSVLSANIWRDGTGVIGEANAAAISGNPIILKSYTDLWYFEVGMQFVIAGSLDTERTVTKVDRGKKEVSFTPAVAVAANAKLYFPADSSTSGAGSFDGVSKIITESNLSAKYRGIDRSLDPTRLAGWNISAKAYNANSNPRPITECIRRAAVLMSNFFRSVDGKMNNLPNDVFLGSAAWEALSDEYESKTELRRVNSKNLKEGVLGFEGLELVVAGKVLRAWSCPTLNPLTGYLADVGSWRFNWLGEKPKQPVAFQTMTNGTYFKDVEDDSAIEFRMQLHPILSCQAPGLNAKLNLTNVGTRITNYLSKT